ncbi:hypothetical protein BDF22DRAFT_180209 [Syncephalis plumigaleata]|nr:hypothetical protein BDF22DRAFT_180209 [Syncephalis plumigaleata]
MKSYIAIVLAIFVMTTFATSDEIVPCIYPGWKGKCQEICLKSGPNIQFNRCYNYNEADLMCKCNDKDITKQILALFKPKKRPSKKNFVNKHKMTRM